VSASRRFLIAPSLSRLIQKECGSFQVIEGHFAPQSERQSHVRIKKGQAHLVLTALGASPEHAEDRTHVPIAHAEALLQSCPGTVTVERSVVPLAQANVFIDRFITPGPLNLVSVQFTTSAESAAFLAPVWFGAEVSEEDAYTNRTIGLSGLPPALETEVSNHALEAVLDILESVAGHMASNQVESEHEADEDSSLAVRDRLADVAPAEMLPKDVDWNGHASPDKQIASVVRNLFATLSQSTSATNGSGIGRNARSGWHPARL
jgi:CYTH domain-containing protein